MTNHIRPYRVLALFIPLAWILSVFVSCEKHMLAPDPPADPEEIFDYLWNDISNRYTYFDEKDIDWDVIGSVYRKRLNNEMGDNELFRVLGDMLYELKDGHVNLTSSFDRSRNWEWFQSFPLNYSQNLIDRYYLGVDFRITGPLHNKIIDSVMYINYRSFSDKISEANLERIMERANGLKGVIIDVRSNGGGKLANAYALAACFTERSYSFGRERIKTGPGHDDFSTWRTLSVHPREGRRFSGPVVVLINRKSYSATSFFAQMMKTNSGAVLMGDDTGGGGGVPAFGELPNGWKYRFSATQTITPDGEHIEFGVPVDISASLTAEDEKEGIDSIIEAALDWLQHQ